MKKVGVITFSPTGTGKTICTSIAGGMEGWKIVNLDLTLPEHRERFRITAPEIIKTLDHLIVGVPVYAGKIPQFAKQVLELLPRGIITATAVVIYGNNRFGRALFDLSAVLSDLGYKVTSAGAFIGQHSYSGQNFPIAIGRPDTEDLMCADNFGKDIVQTGEQVLKIAVPIESGRFNDKPNEMAMKPHFDPEKCTACGLCSPRCPVGIVVTPGSFKQVRLSDCIGCSACVRVCSTGGRRLKVNPLKSIMIRKFLSNAIKNRRTPLVLLGDKE